MHDEHPHDPVLGRAGRFLVREGKTAGLFIPFGAGLRPGVYEVRIVMGEPILCRIGPAAMPKARLNALSVNELVKKPEAMMTRAEIACSAAYEARLTADRERARNKKARVPKPSPAPTRKAKK